jgi:hypothetical protein
LQIRVDTWEEKPNLLVESLSVRTNGEVLEAGFRVKSYLFAQAKLFQKRFSVAIFYLMKDSNAELK